MLLCFQILRHLLWVWELNIHICEGLPWSITPCVFSWYLRSTFYSFCWPPLSSVKSELFCVPWRTRWSRPLQCQALAVLFMFCHCLFLFLSSAFHGASVLWSPWWITIYKAHNDLIEFLPHGYAQVLTLCLNKANWILQACWDTEPWRWPFQWSGWWAPFACVQVWTFCLLSEQNQVGFYVFLLGMGINLFTCNTW